MTDSNMEEKKKKIETPETDALFKRIEETSITPGFDKWGTKAYARVDDFLDNRFLGNQKSFDQILEERSKRDNEYKRKREEISEEITKTKTSQVIRGAITGPLKAVNETVEFFDDIYDYLAGNPYDNNDLIDYSHFEREDDGAFYQIPQAVTQFLLPMGLLSKGLKGTKIAALQNPWTRNFIAGFITDFVVEDPYEENLFNMIDSFEGHKGIPLLETTIDIFKLPATAFKAKDDISPIEARLRKAFGGSLLGETLTALSIAFKGLRNSPDTVKRILETLENKKKVLFKDDGIDAAGNNLSDFSVIKENVEDTKVQVEDTTKTNQDLSDLNLPDTRGQGKFYHGAAQEVKLVEGGEFGKGVENLYGDGFYTTDDLITGSKYRKKNKVKGETSTGIVYEVTEKQPVKFFDLDAPATPERIDQLRNIFNVGEYEAIDVVDRALDQIGSNASIAQIYDEIKLISNANDLSANTTANMFSHFTEELQREGFGGLTHRGGKKAAKGKRLHQVRIYFDPANSLEINPVNFNKFKAEPAVGKKIQSTFNPKLTPETTANGIEGLRKFVLDGAEYLKEADNTGKWPFSRTFGDMLAAANHQTNGEAIEIGRFFIKEFGNFGPKDLAAATINLNRIMNKNADELFQLASKLDEAITTKNIDLIKTVKDNFIEETKLLQGVVYLNKGVKSITGQTLVANKLGGNLSEVAATVDDFGKKTKKITKDTDIDSINKDFIETTEFDEIETTFNKIFELVEQGDTNAAKSLVRLTRYMQVAGGNPEVMKKMTKNLFLKGVEFTNEIYINSILSGPPTHIVNMVSTGFNTLAKPLERSLGAGQIKFRKNSKIPYNLTRDSLSNLTFRPEFNSAQFKRGYKEFVYIIQAMGDAFNIAKKSFNMNENILDRGAMIQETQSRVSRNINAEDVRNFGNESVTGLNLRKQFVDLTMADAYIPQLYNSFRFINGFGSRLLISEDEFFKQVNFRAFVKSEAWEKGISKGKQGAELTKYINEQFNKVIQITESGSTRGLPTSVVDLYKKAKNYAADATFTKDLPSDSFGAKIQNLANHPMGRIPFPFVRTPVNIFKAQVRRTPGLNVLFKEYRQRLLSSDEAISSAARGEMYLGGAFWTQATILAMGINDDFSPIAMTGGGPNTANASGRALMKQKLESGWQPYSLRFLKYDKLIGGKPIIGKDGKPKYNYISIKRLDPWSSFFMLAADFSSIAGQLSEDDRFDWATAASVAFGRNFTNKTFLQGITELSDAMSDPFMLQSLIERRMANIANPVAGLGRSINKIVNPTKFDTTYMPGDDIVMLRQFYNELARTVGGYSADLYADQNWITGSFVDYPVGFGPDIFNVLNPFTATTSKDNLVLTVINDLNIELLPPQKELLKKKSMPGSGIPLNRGQYAEFVNTIAFHKIGNKRLIEVLYLYLNKDTTKAMLATANGENINASNMDEQVAIKNQAAAKIEEQIRSYVSTYKKEALKAWLLKPHNKGIYERYNNRLNIQNQGTIDSVLENLKVIQNKK